MRSVDPFILGLLALSAFAQVPAKSASKSTYFAPPPHVLSAGDHIRLDIPTFGGVGNARCDASGDLFFGDLSFSAGSPFVGRGPYLEVRADGRQHQIFTLPEDLTSHGYNVWAITPDGTLYVLHDDDSGNDKLVKFRSDGSVADSSLLALPENIELSKMAVANSGTIFVSGYRITEQDYKKPEPGFAAIFVDGKMIRDLSAGRPKVNPGMLGGDLIAGDDGRFYLLGGNAVHVFSQSGEQLAEIRIVKPAPTDVVLRIDESQGTLSIVFYALKKAEPGRASTLVPTAVLLDAQTGDIRGTYTFDPALTNSVDCFNGTEYTMVSVDHGMMALDEVPIQ